MIDNDRSKILEEAMLVIETAEAVCDKLGVKFLAIASVDFTTPDPSDSTKTISASDLSVFNTNLTTPDIAKLLFAMSGVFYNKTIGKFEIKENNENVSR